MAESGNLVIIHKRGGFVKRLSPSSERKIRDLVEAESGPEIVMERRGGAFTSDLDIKDEKKAIAREQKLSGRSRGIQRRRVGAERWTWMQRLESQRVSLESYGKTTMKKSSATNAMRFFAGGRAKIVPEKW